MDNIDIYIYYDNEYKKYISYMYLLTNECIINEDENLFLCLSKTYKYINIICYNERVKINKDCTYINILDNEYKCNNMNFKYRDIYDIIF
jgi:hypothetical protein